MKVGGGLEPRGDASVRHDPASPNWIWRGLQVAPLRYRDVSFAVPFLG